MKTTLFFLLILVYGCSGNQAEKEPDTRIPAHLSDIENLTVIPSDTKPKYEISFTPVAEIQDIPGGMDYIIHVTDYMIDDSGNLLIADGSYGNCRIHLFDADGTFIKTIGRNGRGPGEFLNIEKLILKNDSLYVFDNMQKRISIFQDPNYVLVKTLDLEPSNFKDFKTLQNTIPKDIFILEDKKFLVGFLDIPSIAREDTQVNNKFFTLNSDWNILDKNNFERIPPQNVFMMYNGSKNMTRHSFMNQSLLDVSSDGTIYSAWSEDFLVKIYHKDGEYKSAIYYPFEKSTFNDDSFLNRFDEVWKEQPEQLRNWKARNRTLNFPDTWPALHDLIVDDENRIWVSTIIDNDEEFLWWVLDSDGTLLAKFTWEGERLFGAVGTRHLKRIKNGFFYDVEMNQDASRKITKYKIVLSPVTN